MFKLIKRLFGYSPRPARAAVPSAVIPAPSSKITRVGDAAPGVEVASLSLRAILDKFPPDLKTSINALPEAGVKVVLPVNAIMKQLPSGAVKMSLRFTGWTIASIERSPLFSPLRPKRLK